jgi:hypothetical protein
LQQISWLQWKQPHGNKEFPWNIELEWFPLIGVLTNFHMLFVC